MASPVRVPRFGFWVVFLVAVFPSALWAQSVKTGRTLYPEEEVVRIRARATAAQKAAYYTELGWLLSKSDADLWNFVPPADQIRAMNVQYGADCPVHGEKIHQARGHYPWIMTREAPFKLKCPVGNEIYPSNDFIPWHHGGLEGRIDKTAPYVDDGLGWVAPDGKRYWFVAYYVFWERWREDILSKLPRLGEAYLVTGDPLFAHKAAILLARIAQEYPRMDFKTQAYIMGRFQHPSWEGGIFDRIWENEVVLQCATTYDMIFPSLWTDDSLAPFLLPRGVAVFAEHVEQNLLQNQAMRLLRGTISGNMGMHQRAALTIAVVLGNRDAQRGPTRQQLIDFVMKGPAAPPYVGPWGVGNGGMEDLLWNSVYRDGFGGESSPGYSGLWTQAFFDIAELLELLGIDLFSNPKLKKMALLWIDLPVAGLWIPDIGDSGSVRGSRWVGWYAKLFERAYRKYRDPRFAQALVALGARTGDLYHDSIDEEVRQVVASVGTLPPLQTRLLDGYGLSILESGAGSVRRGTSLYYGYSGGGHGHRDRLTIQHWAFGRPILTDMGYPTHWMDKNRYWTNNTLSHYTVTVDRRGQDGRRWAGRLVGQAGAPGLQWTEATAEEAYPGVVSQYRRTTAQIDLDDDRSYLFDVFRVDGGTQHDWSFHGPAFGEFSSEGLSFGSVQSQGTLAGPEIPFGTAYAEKDSGFQYLFNVQRAPVLGSWSAKWEIPTDQVGLKVFGWPSSPVGETEAILADAEPEFFPNLPRTMKYLLQRRTGPGLSSSFAVVAEPYQTAGRIFTVRPVALNGGSPGAVAAKVVHAMGEDLVVSGTSSSTTGGGENVSFAGRFGTLSFRPWLASYRRLRGASLVDGSRIAEGAFSLWARPSPRIKIAALDLHRNAIRLLHVPEGLSAMVGEVLTIENARHSTNYTIRSVDPRTGWVGFGDVSPVIARGVVGSAAGSILRSVTALSGYGRVYGAKFDGMRLVNEMGQYSFLITGVTGSDVQTVGPELAGCFPDVDQDGCALFQIVDFGTGDYVRLPSYVSLRSKGGPSYDVKTTSPFWLAVPGCPQVRVHRNGQPVLGTFRFYFFGTTYTYVPLSPTEPAQLTLELW